MSTPNDNKVEQTFQVAEVSWFASLHNFAGAASPVPQPTEAFE
jgi:hypothetical protein